MESKGDMEVANLAKVMEDVRQFFVDPDHWIYRSRGTPSLIGPDAVLHVGQLEVLFEDRHFHFRTNAAVRRLREEGFLREQVVAYDGSSAIIVWRPGLRYTKRLVTRHVSLIKEYSSEALNKATGSYAETLTLLGLRGLHLDLVGRNTREYRGNVWKETDHDLDFIFERDRQGQYLPSPGIATPLHRPAPTLWPMGFRKE
jgi:hypothetical protein